MDINRTPRYDMTDNETGCCPRFNPEGWDMKELRFRDKPFVKARTWSLFHIPMNMGSVFQRVIKAIGDADAVDMEQFLALSHDPSPWRGEHYFAVDREVPGEEMVRLSGDLMTRVFEGPYRNAPLWMKDMEGYVKSKKKTLRKIYFFYTTCPNCAKHYEKNYVVAVAEVK